MSIRIVDCDGEIDTTATATVATRDVHSPRREEAEAALRIRVFADEHGLGVLTLYATSMPATLERGARRLGELLAGHAALALGRSDRNLDGESILGRRRVIGQAVSVLMERYRLAEDRAYEYLVRTCQHSSLQLPDLAEEVVADTAGCPWPRGDAG